MEAQRIVELQAERFKRLKAVQINPDRTLVEITGRNGAGKSSVLDAIECALAGKSHHPAEPVQRGATKARIVVQTDDLVVERKWTRSGNTYLSVIGRDGRKLNGGPQDLLDKLIGDLSFDPLYFTRMKPTDQVAALCRGLKIDAAKFKADRDAAFEDRRLVNRDVRDLEGQVARMPEHGDAGELVSVDDLLTEQERAQQIVNANNAKRQQLDKAREHTDTVARQIHELEQRLALLRVQHQEAQQDQERLGAEIADLTDPAVGQIAERIRTAGEHNERVRANRARADALATLAMKRDQADNFTRRIEALDEEKRRTVAQALGRLGIEGLSLDDEMVRLHGLPLAQASHAEQLRLSVALAFAFNAKLRVVLIREGSVLDADSLAAVAEMARQFDGQVWIERVADGDGGVGILIEDGTIVGARAAQPAAAI